LFVTSSGLRQFPEMPAAGLVLSKKKRFYTELVQHRTLAGFSYSYSSMEALPAKKSRLLTLFTGLYPKKIQALFVSSPQGLRPA